MWEWVTVLYVHNRANEMQSNFTFFICVWLLPMLLFLNMEVTWTHIEIRGFEDQLKPGLDSIVLGWIQRLIHGKRSESSGMRRRSMSGQFVSR